MRPLKDDKETGDRIISQFPRTESYKTYLQFVEIMEAFLQRLLTLIREIELRTSKF